VLSPSLNRQGDSEGYEVPCCFVVCWLTIFFSGNIEGKTLEQLVYLGGLDDYDQIIRGVLAEGAKQWAGFNVT
jgi:hypothetical protein